MAGGPHVVQSRRPNRSYPDHRLPEGRYSDGPAAPPYPTADTDGPFQTFPRGGKRGPGSPSPPGQASEILRIIGAVRLEIGRAALVAGTARQSGVPAGLVRARPPPS